MTEQVAYWRSIYTRPNYKEDLRQNSPFIYVGTYPKAPTPADINMASLREAVIKANFQAKTQITQLGEMICVPKVPSARYEWKVIAATITTLFSKLETACVAVIYLVGFPAALLHDWYILLFVEIKVLLIVLMIFKIVWAIGFYKLFIKPIQKPYVDGYVVFQRVSCLPNSMAGFDLTKLDNQNQKDGWDDPITLELIPSDQITSSHILRIGQYAILITSALQSMLTTHFRECHAREIPHPVEARPLTPDEKAKFLHEVSAFFAISPDVLEKCWSIRVEDNDISRYITKIKYWSFLPALLKIMAMDDLENQLLPIKRKQAFLKLLTDSIAQQYFSEQFRRSDVSIPTFTMAQIGEEIARGSYATAALVYVSLAITLHNSVPTTPTSGQSDNAGPP